MEQQVMTYRTFGAFYPFYLSQHRDPICRSLHYAGSALTLVVAGIILVLCDPGWLLILPFIGYGFAWIGHFFFEKNKPATFTYPLYSFMGDWVMFAEWIMQRKLI